MSSALNLFVHSVHWPAVTTKVIFEAFCVFIFEVQVNLISRNRTLEAVWWCCMTSWYPKQCKSVLYAKVLRCLVLYSVTHQYLLTRRRAETVYLTGVTWHMTRFFFTSDHKVAHLGSSPCCPCRERFLCWNIKICCFRVRTEYLITSHLFTCWIMAESADFFGYFQLCYYALHEQSFFYLAITTILHLYKPRNFFFAYS